MIQDQTAKRLAEFITGLRYEDIPGKTLEKAKQFVLDIVRLAVLCSELPWGQRTRDVFAQIGGKEESTLLGFGDRLPAINAAYVNGTTAHGLENDDTHVGAINHPGVAVVPAVLAVAEREALGGTELLRAMIVGYEVMIRLGVALQPSLMRDRGFHCTSVMGHFGAAAGAANLLGLSAEQTAHALAYAAAYASGLHNYTYGGMIKHLHAGKAAKGGVEAALLAAAGLTGPRRIFEGKNAFCNAYAEHYNVDAITAGLGEEWRTLEVHLKPHCTSRHIQSSIEAAAIIASEHDLHPSSVASIEVRTSPEGQSVLSTVAPVDVFEVLASIPFAVATALFKGGSRTLKEFVLFEDLMKARENPEVRSLAERTHVLPDSDFSYTKGDSEVTIQLKDGKTHTRRVDIIHGSPENPFTAQEVYDRFVAQAGSVLPRERMVEAADLIYRLEAVKDVKEVTRMLQR
ncbi:MAG: MmgE/PrpD family protein [candidate division NC10 bacterium]|nr:MmgE/PrpD family protein [candidate division NC10 bacterium]